MKTELDKQLCQDYPKIFANRHGDMKETLMCWGFECGDGWYNILNALCGNIQSHIDWSEKQVQWNKEYNEMYEAMKAGDNTAFDDMAYNWSEDFKKQRYDEILRQGPRETEPCPQVVAMQVKEKFGTLRFYYEGGDDYVSGLTSMAESMSAFTCEVCGNLGTQSDGGWIKTTCEEHKRG